MTGADRRQYKASMVEALDNVGGEFHVVAQLPVHRSRAALEDSLYAWAGRIDRFYLGRSWAAPARKADRMKGVVFFERSGGNDHAHMIIAPPAGASLLHFECSARFFF